LQAAFHVLRRPKGDLKGEATIIQCGWTLVFDTASPARTRGAEAASMFRPGRAQKSFQSMRRYVPPLPDAAE